MPGLAEYLSMYQSGGPGGRNAGGGSPFAPMGGGGTPAVGAPQAAAPAARGNGFNALLSPDSPGILGILGKLAGNPTREEWLFQRAGQAQQGGAAALAESIAQGKPPQQAVVDFINSPEGMEFFATVPNPNDEIKRILTNIQAPEAPDPIKLGAGEGLYQPDGTPIVSQPTTELQDFSGMAEIANLSPEETAKLAEATMRGKLAGDPTQTEAAVAEMVANDEMSPETARKVRAGLLQVQPVLDPAGNSVGHVIIDITDPSNPQYISPAHGQTNLPVLPGDQNYAPGLNDDGRDPYAEEEPGRYLKEFPNPADIIEGAGVFPALAEYGGGFLGAIIPGMADAGVPSTKMRAALNQIKNDSRALKDTGRYLKDDLKVLDSIQPETGSLFESPVQAGEKLVQYRIMLEERLAKAREAYADPRGTGESRGKAILELRDIEKAMANVPTVPQLQSKIAELKTRATSPAQDAIQGAKDNIGKVISGAEQVEQTALGQRGPDVPVPEYDSMDVLRDHLNSGKLQYGTKIMYKGAPMRVDRTKPKGAGK